MLSWSPFQLTAARRRLVPSKGKAQPSACFNSQPPEGGWWGGFLSFFSFKSFNSQPPEGGWLTDF